MTENHVREVMHMMRETRATYSKETLIAAQSALTPGKVTRFIPS